MTAALYAWRHPRVAGTEGRCIGAGTDWGVDPRRAKRLARRIQRVARREGLPRLVVTSPLKRCAAVGRWLRRWGWRHRIDPALAELHFGDWEGRLWTGIGRPAVDAWCADFAHHAPGGGESLAALLARAAAWQAGPARVLVGHAGWLQARAWARAHPGRGPRADEWPPPPRPGALLVWAEADAGAPPATS